jgi:hypothetical protein
MTALTRTTTDTTHCGANDSALLSALNSGWMNWDASGHMAQNITGNAGRYAGSHPVLPWTAQPQDGIKLPFGMDFQAHNRR